MKGIESHEREVQVRGEDVLEWIHIYTHTEMIGSHYGDTDLYDKFANSIGIIVIEPFIEGYILGT